MYDGECPLCKSAAHAIKINKEYGALHLIDAREAADHPLIKDITMRGLDLDEGMVIYTKNHFYHGKEALKFMAQYGDAHNLAGAVCKALFWSDFIASLSYPWMRSIRNVALRLKGTGRIDNVKKK